MLSKVLQSVLTALILAALTWIAAKATDGWLVRSLGGATTAEIAALKSELQLLKDKTAPMSYTNETLSIKVGPHHLNLQRDGNVVVYNSSEQALWNSKTSIIP